MIEYFHILRIKHEKTLQLKCQPYTKSVKDTITTNLIQKAKKSLIIVESIVWFGRVKNSLIT